MEKQNIKDYAKKTVESFRHEQSGLIPVNKKAYEGGVIIAQKPALFKKLGEVVWIEADEVTNAIYKTIDNEDVMPVVLGNHIWRPFYTKTDGAE